MAKEFSVTVLMRETGEIFTVNEVSNQTKIVQLKIDLEIIAGIPTTLQRLMYLDQGLELFALVLDLIELVLEFLNPILKCSILGHGKESKYICTCNNLYSMQHSTL